MKFETLLTLVVVFLLFATPPPNSLVTSMVVAFGLNDRAAWMLAVLIIHLMSAVLILVITIGPEKQQLASIGFRRPGVIDILLAVAVFSFASSSAAALTGVLAQEGVFSTLTRRQVIGPAPNFGVLPLWLRVAVALGNGTAEEISCRGYAIERLGTAVASRRAVALLVFAVSVVIHVPSRGWVGAIILAPGLLAFVLLYVWRRNLPACILAHALSDALPLVLWPLLPARIQRDFWEAFS